MSIEDVVNAAEAALQRPGAVLTSDRVRELFVSCVHPGEGHDAADVVFADGIIRRAVPFSRAALERHRDEIVALLAELPEQFHQGAGGGWSFLNACLDRHGNQWTGLHQVMEELFLLGLAVGRVRYLLPRESWDALPGGMPYLVVVGAS